MCLSFEKHQHSFFSAKSPWKQNKGVHSEGIKVFAYYYESLNGWRYVHFISNMDFSNKIKQSSN